MSENNNKGIVITIVIVVLVIVGVVGWYFLQYKPGQEAKEKARQEQIAKAAAEKKAAEEAAQKKANYEKLIQDGDAAFEQEDWETARSRYSDASALFPNEQYPRDQLVLVNAKLDELATREAGVVDTVSSRTGRFYVIVSSSIDDDLAMDYAQKLANEGNTVKLIEHDNGKNLYYRVSLGDYTSRDQAEAAIPSFSSYGEGIWVLGY